LHDFGKALGQNYLIRLLSWFFLQHPTNFFKQEAYDKAKQAAILA